MVNIFTEGFPQDEKQMAASHIANEGERKYLLDEIPDYASLINAGLRIPGPIKNNEYLSEIFECGFKDFISNFDIKKRVVWDVATGPEAFAIVNSDAQIVKTAAVKFENENPLGEIFDIDVYIVHGDTLGSLNRKDLHLQPRKCLICDKTAEECIRERNHSVEELQAHISKLINDYKK
ncbi:citrate lyase holo-[acyl-carrier protein] synthase [Companilactobacillus sp. HBUAS59699]|uniref:citrate lyase holo-[acyl-carrier protein] synthase n=1 Tax=Companilactobacillus sp. HBUAS59699 TaxID=3109358 RepID=UPI002FF16895